MAGKTFNIGQIIYILSNKSQSVVPAIVSEEDTRKVRKIDGIHEVINYKLSIGPKERQRVIELGRIDGEIFTSLEEIRTTLVERLTSFVDGLVKDTQNNVMNWYGITADNQSMESENLSAGERFDPEQIINSVNNNLPLTQQGAAHPLQLTTPNSHSSLRDNIRSMVSEDELQGSAGSTQMIIMPDGTKVPIKMNI